MNQTRTAYLEAAEAAARLVALPEVVARWDEAGESQGMTVGATAAHLVGSGIEMLVPILDGDDPSGPRTLDSSRYFSGQSLDLTHEGHQDVRKRAATAASERDATHLAADAATAVRGLTLRLAQEPEGRRVVVLGKFEMTLDGFLVTRLVEVLAHADDLAASAGLQTPDFSPDAVTLVTSCLTDVARRRHGDLAVLRAMARRERSIEGVFPVF